VDDDTRGVDDVDQGRRLGPLHAAQQRSRYVRERLVHARPVARGGPGPGLVEKVADVPEQGAPSEALLQRAHGGLAQELLDRRQPAAQVGVRAHAETISQTRKRAWKSITAGAASGAGFTPA
jgi:hypothetical protein